MDFSIYVEFAPVLLKGLYFTLYICSLGLAIGLIGGLLLYGLGQINLKLTKLLYNCYITLFRGTPLLVQVYLVFYGGPFIGLNLTAEQVGILGLGLYVSAYFAEIYRAGFSSIPKGQLEAAYDLGYTRLQVLRHIQIPQMLGLILPPSVNQTIIMIKESAILSIITVPEITTAAVNMATRTFTVIEPYLFLAVAYWTITFFVSKLGLKLEKKATAYMANSN